MSWELGFSGNKIRSSFRIKYLIIGNLVPCLENHTQLHTKNITCICFSSVVLHFITKIRKTKSQKNKAELKLQFNIDISLKLSETYPTKKDKDATIFHFIPEKSGSKVTWKMATLYNKIWNLVSYPYLILFAIENVCMEYSK